MRLLLDFQSEFSSQKVHILQRAPVPVLNKSSITERFAIQRNFNIHTHRTSTIIFIKCFCFFCAPSRLFVWSISFGSPPGVEVVCQYWFDFYICFPDNSAHTIFTFASAFFLKFCSSVSTICLKWSTPQIKSLIMSPKQSILNLSHVQRIYWPSIRKIQLERQFSI